jgi:ABC-type antimicrobial peptide transport system permease subunit
VNLNTAIAVRRSKEVGLRKTLGGTKTQLTLHFLGETALITFISIILGIGITEIALHGIEPILGFTPALNLLSNPELISFLGILFIVITLGAGWYPARHLSRFNPIEAIRNKINSSYGQGLVLRRSLIIVQFSITQILVIGTLIISSQIKFFQTNDLGYDIEAIVEFTIPNDEKQVLDTFKNRLLSESSIQNVTFSNTGTTSNNTWSGNYLVMKDSIRIENNAQVKFTDNDFVETYGLTILAGRDLAHSDTMKEFLVNEAFAKQVGYGNNYEELIGKYNHYYGVDAPIVGVVKDFHTESLHTDLSPVVVTTRRLFYTGAIHINEGQTKEALTAIEESYKSAFPDYIFEYEFLDDSIAKMYENEQRTARIMDAFTIVAVVIGYLGLFGLISYMIATRTKEIGVRKVLGASITDILKIFGTELALLTGISYILAAPISWYLMQKWLSNFAYRIDIGAGIFALALAGTVLLAILTVGYKSLSAAMINPVDSLRSE